MNDKFLKMTGLAYRAGKVSAGEEQCEKSVRKKRARLVLIARDASENTRKSVSDCCAYYGVEYREAASKEQLGQYTGRAQCAAVSVNDDNFAKAILDRL